MTDSLPHQIDGKQNPLLSLDTEQRNARTMHLDEMQPMEILAIMNEEDLKVVAAVKAVLPKINQVIAWTAGALQSDGRIVYCGAGTSGRIGILDAVECPPTFGVSYNTVVGVIAGGDNAFIKAEEGAEDNPQQGMEALKGIQLTEKDVVIGLAASGRTPFVMGAMHYARSLGCHTAAISCNRSSEISQIAEIAIEMDTGPEILTGSTRLKAGTAQKMVLNMISTVSMVETGKVYENLMVDVRQTNEKLVIRAENIVMEAVHCDRRTAQEALTEAGGEAKLAITKMLLNCDIDEARERLKKAKGKIRNAL